MYDNKYTYILIEEATKKMTSVRKPRGRKKKYFTEADISRARLQASLKYNNTDGGKSSRNRYYEKQRDIKRRSKMIKYFSEDALLYETTLKESLHNVELLKIARKLLEEHTTNH